MAFDENHWLRGYYIWEVKYKEIKSAKQRLTLGIVDHSMTKVELKSPSSDAVLLQTFLDEPAWLQCMLSLLHCNFSIVSKYIAPI